jgi:diguanylate cyclase (GGDEF)-like protein/putative nucleotidyltransferase with HDIG domain
MSREKFSILVADKSLPHINIIKSSLTSDDGMNYNIVTAKSGRDVLEKASSEKIDLVLVNKSLTGSGGISMLQEITKRKLGVPVIMIVAEGDEKLGVKAMDKGAFDFLTAEEVKTIALNRAIRRVVHRRKLEKDINASLKKLEKLAIKDGLTGLYNQHHFREVIKKEYKKSKRYMQQMSCIMLDLDHFKSVNDKHGHQFGDFVLYESAEILNRLVRDTDFVARYGGEEFFIILPNTDLEGSVILAERIRASFANNIFRKSKIAEVVTVSIGVTTNCDDNVLNENDLIENADKALYRAKWRGRNIVCTYSEPETGGNIAVTEDLSKIENFHDKLSNMSEDMKQNCIESAHNILRDIENGWDYFNEHSIRVSSYVEKLTKELLLSEDEIKSVKRAALLHDIGMAGIDSIILKKKKKLTKEEYDIVKKHTHIGVKIVEKTRLFEKELPMILYHHERYDGTGYPHKLKGETIPYGARILAVVEAYDSMMSDTIYRKAGSLKEVIAELRECAGTQFDPHMVETFIKVIDKG